MITLLIYFAIACIVVILVFWLLSQVPIPEPARKFVTIGLVVVVAIVVIYFLLQLAGVDGLPLRR